MTSRAFSILLVLFVLTITGRPQAQVASVTKSFGSVEGHVICDDGGFPARRATVRLLPLARLLTEERKKASVPSGPEDMWTDFNGNYIFSSVQPGTYILEVLQDGYSNDLELLREVLDSFGPAKQKELLSEFPQVTVASGSTSRVDGVVHRAGAISGQVSFDDGSVLSGAEVKATLVSSSRFNDDDSLTATVLEDLNFSLEARTDDRGNYRIPGMPRGGYRIEVRLTEPGLTDPHRPTRTGRAELTLFAPEALSKADSKLRSEERRV